MNNKIKHIEAYILAGGKSSRMGVDKGLLLLNDKRMVEKTVEQLRLVFDKIIIVSNNPAYQQFGLKVIEDLKKNIGPAGGIHAALMNTETSHAFITCCDMPFVKADAINYIVQKSDESQITLPFHDGKIEPLFGVYSKDCLQQWAQLLEQGIVKLQEMVTYFKLSEINVENQLFFSEKLFLNVNDKNDFTTALQQL